MNNALEIASSDLRAKVEKLVDELAASQVSISQKAVQLGAALLAVRNSKAFKEWGFSTWGSYITALRERVDKGRTALFQYVSIAENLLPYVSEKQIEGMGLAKASELKKMVVLTGKKPSPELIEKGTRSTMRVEEFKAEVAAEYHVRSPEDKGKWWDAGGFFLSPDERKEIEYAMSVAERTDPVIVIDLPDWARRKEIFLRFAREYIATYSALVEQGTA